MIGAIAAPFVMPPTSIDSLCDQSLLGFNGSNDESWSDSLRRGERAHGLHIQKTMLIAEESKSTANVAVRLDQRNLALAMCREVHDQAPRVQDRATVPALDLSFSTFDGIMSEISRLGDVITTHLVDSKENTHQVATMSSPLLTSNKLNRDYCRTAFSRFQMALDDQVLKKNASYSNPWFKSIGCAVAPIVLLPPLSDFMYIRMVASSGDSHDSK
ncbi:hypothetical protein PFISCL1PPCAC_21540, partial [Pristionchus fissidentatus]